MMTKLQPADKAWLALLAGILGYDIAAPAGQTLSEAVDRYMVRHRWLARLVGVSLLAHVCNFIPPRLDPIHGMFLLARRIAGSIRK